MFHKDVLAMLPADERQAFVDLEKAVQPSAATQAETREQQDARLLEIAPKHGITKDELIDAGVAIARRAAQIFGAALSSETLHLDSRYKDHILALTVYEGGTPSDDVCAAIKDLALLTQLPNRVHARDMTRIGRLLCLHAEFRRTTPAGYDHAGFFNEITDIGVNIEMVFMNAKPGHEPRADMKAVLRDSLERLARVLDKLWS